MNIEDKKEIKYPRIPLEQCRNRKLMPEQIDEIKRRYIPRVVSMKKLGEEFGVSWHAIYFHVSEKEHQRIYQSRDKLHAKGRTDPVYHKKILEGRKRNQKRKFDFDYRPLRDYYNAKAREYANR